VIGENKLADDGCKRNESGTSMKFPLVVDFLWCLLLLLHASDFQCALANIEIVDEACSVDSQYGSQDLPSCPSSKIIEFLAGNLPRGRFRIQGWRWHTMSLIRESGLLSLAAATEGSSNHDALSKAADYVINFNMKGLHRVENEVFFPWMRTKFGAVGSPEVREAFLSIFDQVKSDQEKLSELGVSMMISVNFMRSTVDEAQRKAAITQIAQLADSIMRLCQSILTRADSLFVPAIAFLVPESDQVFFNNLVLVKLGVLNSRLHLVGMHEAVLELSEEEQKLFQEEIPSLPRYMIPRWKRLLYEPRAGILASRKT